MANPRWGLLRRSCLKSPEEDQHLKMTRQENLRTASTRFGQSTEAFCRWVTNVEIQVEDANSREAVSSLQEALDVRMEASGGVGGAVGTYPEDEVVRDDQGDEVVDPEQAELERGKYRIRMEYLITAEEIVSRSNSC